MKKHLLALAASAFAFIVFAEPPTGNIYSIDPINAADVGRNFESGEKIQFRVRLLAGNYKDPTPTGWSLKYTSIGSEEYDKYMSPLKFGIVVSGRLAEADVIEVRQNPVTVGTEKAYPFTDLICEYKVKAGDLALPVLLALKGSTDAKPITPGSEETISNEYYLFNSDRWSIVGVDASGSPAVCKLYFCDIPTATDASSSSNWQSAGIGTQVRDYSLAQCNFRAKAIDFDANKDTPDYWREVSETTTQTTYKPTIVTIGAPAEDAQDIYVWSKDEAAVVMAGDAQEMDIVIDRLGHTTKKMVAIVKIRSGITEYPITIKGTGKGMSGNGTTELVLSPVLGYQFNTVGDELANYLTAKVRCSDPPSPNIQISFDPANPTTAKNKTVATSMKTTENLAEDVVPVYVTISESYASDFTLQIAVKNEGALTVDPITNRNISVSQFGDAFTASDNSYTNLTIKAGDTSAVFYVYPLGGDAATQAQGISFTPVLTDPTVADHYDLGSRALLRVQSKHTPVIETPAAGTDYDAQDAGGFQVPVQVADCYRDMTNPKGFKVDVDFSDGSKMATTNIVFAENTEVPVTIKDYGVNATYANIKITEPDGTGYAQVKVLFTVKPQKTIAAALYDSTDETSKHVGTSFAEGDAPIVRFSLSEKMAIGADRYAFLVPQNAASSNLVDCAAFKEGVLIPGGQTNSVLNIKWSLRLNDGCATTDGTSGILSYKIVLRTADKIDAGEPDETFTATEPLQLTVRNVYPTTDGVFVNGSPEAVPNGTHWPNLLSSGVKIPFNLNVSDVSITDQTNGLITVFCFTDGRRSDTWKYEAVTTGVDRVSCEHSFSSPGTTQTVQVVTIDKDLLASLTTKPIAKEADLKTLWPSIIKVIKPYTFTVGVSSKPHVEVETYGFNGSHMTEANKNNPAKIRVTLSEPVEEDVTVRLIAIPAAESDRGTLEFATDTNWVDPGDPAKGVYTDLKIAADRNEPNGSATYTADQGLKFRYTTLNGTAGSMDYGWEIQAEVMAKKGDTYYDYFAKAEGLMIYLDNEAPRINNKTQAEIDAMLVTTNKSVTLGQDFQITWTPSDVNADVDATWPNTTPAQKGLKAEWFVNDVAQPSLTKYVTRPGAGMSIGEQTTTLRLNEEGLSVVRLVVTDVDGADYNGSVERSWYYYISPTKKLVLTPIGPVNNSKTRYGTAAGRGIGRVWADGGNVRLANFVQTWGYTVSVGTGTAHAFGYPSAAAPYDDNGTLGPGTRDVALTKDGELWTAGNAYYQPENAFDNYFYRWVYIVPSENGGAPTVEQGLIQPTTQANADTAEPVVLDPFEANKESYLDRQLEAIFSRELYPNDNLGDINGDGVPDVYLRRYVDLGVIDASGNQAGDDFAKIGGANPDEDFLPADITASFASFVPGLSNTWVTTGRAFTTRDEIRGIARHFNNGPQLSKVAGAKSGIRYTDPDLDAVDADLESDQTSTLSDLEYCAFTNWCARAELDPADEANWAKWSPERPTDPTMADTDEDGMTDGYEYYFWYKAHVGEVDRDKDGKITAYRRMTGRRYVPADPCHPEIIPSDWIEQNFDPLTARNDFVNTTDTDNDGIPDLVEFAIGTNPVDYDTDGDGLPDGYELAISKTDPCVADRGANVDGDQMALITLENVIPVTCVYTNGDETVTNMLWSMESVRVAENEEDGSITNLTTKTSLFTGYVYDIDNEGKPVWALGRLVLDAKDEKYDDKVKEYNVIHVGEGRPMRAIHFQVFAIKGFDPRVAWNTEAAVMTPIAHRVDTTGFTAYDEFMTMTFFLNVGAIEEADVTPKPNRTLINIWTECTTNPLNADTDGDGVPDGWELYVMGQGEFTCQNPMPPAGQGHDNHSPMINWTGHDDVIGGLNYVEEFCGIESCARYEDCETIVNVHPEWKNKYWPTNPFNPDTDGDGVGDVAEKVFIYGDAPASTVYSGAIPGGGLNPNSWDTDLDGLPDGWELQFACSILVSSTTTTVETHSDTNGTTTVTNTVTTAGGPQADGMDGTVKDQMKDYDHDGLNNWQEYMVGAMRCWRYDDTTSPWAVAPLTREDVEVFSDEDFYETLVNTWSEAKNPRDFTRYNPFLASGHVSPYIYFSVANNEFDLAFGRLYMLKDGIYHDLVADVREGDNRWSYMARNQGQPAYNTHDTLQRPAAPKRYISCDPTTADTDGDGLDDYYELFHGLNPLLGALGMYTSTVGPCDVVAAAYYDADLLPLPCSAANNYWFNPMLVNTGTVNDKAQLKDPSQSMFDFVQFPWLAGLPEADPDGDNIRNNQEQILPGVQAAATYQHLDPSPLWMTDSSYTNSIVRRFYKTSGGVLSFPHPTGTFTHTDTDGNTTTYSFNDIPGWHWDAQSGLAQATTDTNPFKTLVTMFTFEENEGYDTDHDYLSDFEESQGKTKSSSDPQLSEDPVRHQAMWFDGKDAFLQTEVPTEWILPNDKSISEFRQNFLYFTVEAWVKADASLVGAAAKPGLFTVVERPIWTGPSNAGDESFLRKNFLIGIKNGRWYAKFDSSGTDLNQPIEIKEGPEATAAWTHVAATFGPADESDTEGTGPMALKLYVDGILRKSLRSGVQPEHGIKAYTYVPDAKVVPTLEWDDMIARPLVSILVGASAKNIYGIKFDGFSAALPTLPSDYTSFFKGHVDEVRIWDGARSAASIKSDVEQKTRYTTALALANRQSVYAKWSQGVTRMPNGSGEMLPPELMYHFSFDHIPGAVEAEDVLKTPAGFTTTKGAVDAKAKWSRPDGWVCPWWDSVTNTLRSAIYTDTAWVPWIGNTVGHLPMFDGETLDSVLWHKNFYGFTSGNFAFPLSAEPMSRMIQQSYDAKGNDPLTQTTSYDRIADTPETLDRFRFTYRNRVTAGFDLLPFGSAFPKRLSSAEGLWDAPGVASDAWAETGVDADNNGLPEWWEEYALVEYADTTSVDWDTSVNYHGIMMPAWQAYLRDVAAGMLPDGVIHPEYADTRDMDKDGLPDWWEDMYGVNTHSASDAAADPDHDGLSNYQEYLIEKDGLYFLNPTVAHSTSGQKENDYFLKTPTGEYLGEVYADHDFIEDNAEDGIGADRHHYDAYSDKDEDGWTAFSEVRYAQFKQNISARFISHLVGEEEVKDCPVPVIHTLLRYNGESILETNSAIVVEAYAGNNLQKSPTAKWTIRPGELQERKHYLGRFIDGVVHGTLTPGHVIVGLDSAKLEMCFVQDRDQWSWTVDGEPFVGTYDEMWAAYSADVTYSHVRVNMDDYSWDNEIINGFEGVGWMQFSVDHQTQKGDILFNHEKVGTIDVTTGDFAIDLSSLGKYFLNGNEESAKQLFYRISYTTKTPAMQNKALQVSLANADIGTLVEGKTSFVAYIDKDGDGYTPDVDAIGFVKDVAVGWDQVPELVIEMSEKTQAGGKAFAYDPAEELIRIVRTSVNGDESIAHTAVYHRDHTRATTTTRNFVYDADYMDNGFGLDWSSLASDVDKMPGFAAKDITSVGYTVVKGKGSIANIDSDSVVTNFTVTYTVGQIKPTAYAPTERQGGQVEVARPTFTWTGGEGYTAFALRIFDASNKTVFDSGYQKLPAKDTNGRYAYQPGVWVADTASTNAFCNLANGSNYTWQVAMFNAKFRDMNEGWSDPAAFTVATAKTNDLSTNYGCAEVEVRYFGRAPGDQNDVIVQLYKNADFAGLPAAQVRLAPTEGESVAALTNGASVVFTGLEAGDYYAVAFLDRELPEQKKDGVRQRYETWGYAAQVDMGLAEIWKPTALRVDPRKVEVPSVTLYLEDTDINQNGKLDFEEEYSAFPADGTGTSDTSAMDDTDGDGMPDNWETKYGLNPYDAEDAESAIAGDVMAYADVDACLVRIGTDGGKAEWYAILDWTKEPMFINDSVIERTPPFPKLIAATNILSAATIWENGSMYGLGTNVTFAAEDAYQVLDSKWGKVRLVHAQVYAFKGFNTKTAVPASDAVDTKAFTALDKYLVGAYFNAIGLADWKSRDLNPTQIDSDGNDGTGNTLTNTGDGLSDGWEMYVMFGKRLSAMTAGLTAAEAKISPYDRTDALKPSPTGESGLKLYEEFDNAYNPTDPWSVDTDGDGVMDKYAYQYHLKADDADKDFDGDGLSNYAEYLITEVFKYAVCSPDVYATNDGVCDYFKKVGDLYLGEIFTDHDQMKDTVEDTMPGVKRDIYDADKDADGNGWSNYAEYRAMGDESQFVTIAVTNVIALADGTTSNDVTTALAYAGQPQPNITAKITYNGTQKVTDSIVIKAWRDPAMATVPDAVWNLTADQLVSKVGNDRTYVLKAPTSGFVKEGLTTFCAFFASAAEEGKDTAESSYTAGAPWGFIRDVNVGWNAATFDLEVTDASPVFARIDVTNGSSDRPRVWGTDTGDSDTAQTMLSIVQSNRVYDATIAQTTLSGGTMNHVRIVPYTISGTKQDTALTVDGRKPVEALSILQNRVVAEFDIDTQTRPYITEADFVTGDKFDIDWDDFVALYSNSTKIRDAVGDITAIKYGIVLGRDGALPMHTADTTTVSRVFSTLIERRYEPSGSRTLPEQLQLREGGILYGGRPTFMWRLDEPTNVGVGGTPSAASFGCSYTAFKLQVWDATSNTLVYDSGLNRAPAKDANGNFVWQAPIAAGAQTDLAQVFAKAGNWKWRVAMFNAKFKPQSRDSANGWSKDWGTFSTAVGQQQLVGDHTYGSVNVAVKYAGPTAVLAEMADLTKTTGKVRVQAFATPDCSGAPCAETCLTDVDSLTNTLDVTTNVALDGLDVGGTYWVRAYIDSDGDGQKGVWESWGGTAEAVTIVANAAAPTVGVWIEDCDTDGDWLPDAYEFVKNGNLSAEGTVIDPNGEIVLKTETYNSVTNGVANISTHLSGASLTFFENLGAAALLLGIEGDTTTSTIQAIRDAVQKKVVPNTLSVKALVVDAANKKVKLTVAGDVADSIAGEIFKPIYTVPLTATIKISVYTKSSLVAKDWIWVKDYPVTVSTTLETTLDVAIEEDLTSGFYKVEVVQ